MHKRSKWMYGAWAVLTLVSVALFGCSSGELASLLGGGGGAATTRLLVVDYGNSRTMLYNLPITTNAPAIVAFGQPDLNSGACATSATTQCSPNDSTMDPSGNVWVADYGNCRILKYAPPFTTGMAASVAIGQPDMTSSGCGVGPSSLDSPANVAFDRNGNMFVLDWENNRVLEFQPPFTTGMSASVVLGQVDLNSSACTTTANGLCDPWQGIAIDANGNLWVGDRGNCRAVRYSPPFTTNMAATLVMGQPDFTSSNCGTSATLNDGLSGVAVDPSGNLWAVDAANNRVLKFAAPLSNGMAATVVIGQPDFTSSGSGTTASTMRSVYDVAFDSSGNLYIAESGNNRVTLFAPPFATGMSATKVLGQPDLTSSGSGTSSTTYDGPEGVTAVQ